MCHCPKAWKHIRGAEVHFHSSSASQLDEMGGQLHAPTALPPLKQAQDPINRRLGGHQSQTGFWKRQKKKSLAPTESRTPDRPARSLVTIRTELYQLPCCRHLDMYYVCIACTMCVLFVLCAYCCFYFRRRTAGYKSVFGRSCDRPPRHRFFLVSPCLKANAEIVPKIPSCHYMLLM